MTEEPDDAPQTLEELAAAAGPPVDRIGDSVLQVAAQISDDRGGVEAHLRDAARELLEARRRIDRLTTERQTYSFEIGQLKLLVRSLGLDPSRGVLLQRIEILEGMVRRLEGSR